MSTLDLYISQKFTPVWWESFESVSFYLFWLVWVPFVTSQAQIVSKHEWILQSEQEASGVQTTTDHPKSVFFLPFKVWLHLEGPNVVTLTLSRLFYFLPLYFFCIAVYEYYLKYSRTSHMLARTRVACKDLRGNILERWSSYIFWISDQVSAPRPCRAG